uniref:Uncharacterized protein n=1 Tax=Anguilla anguilla TaxID=7936 RepID=A0A0E9WUF9_ANGAN
MFRVPAVLFACTYKDVLNFSLTLSFLFTRQNILANLKKKKQQNKKNFTLVHCPSGQ